MDKRDFELWQYRALFRKRTKRILDKLEARKPITMMELVFLELVKEFGQHYVAMVNVFLHEGREMLVKKEVKRCRRSSSI